ncbi:MAG: siroheme synthase CysG [Pseudomonadota bacterium]
MLKTYPISYLIDKQACLVVGGGEVALRKAKQLCRNGAKVKVIASQINEIFKELQSQFDITIEQREFIESDIEDMSIVIAATDDEDLNIRIANLALQKKCLVNVVNRPDAGNFIVPSVVEREPVTIAISTSGASPVLARLLRARIETMIPASYGKLAGLIADFRQRAIKRFPDIQQRREFWENVLQGKVAELLFSGQSKRASILLEREFDAANIDSNKNGEVYLVGGGPGTPDLLTFRALRLMQQADVVLYDRLVSPEIVDLVNQYAERIYVGKERSNHSLPQQDINQLLVDLAKQGKRVLRLKGGDPFIFGRGGEEIELLTENGVPFQIVPGITAANGCSAYAGIPLTHRDYAQSCLFITGHLKDGSMNLNWSALVQPQQTLVVYMGTHGLDILSQELIKHGLSKATPAAIIEQGTTEYQQVYTSTIEDLPSLPENHDIKPPSMIIIGEVVKLRDKLEWYESNQNQS